MCTSSDIQATETIETAAAGEPRAAYTVTGMTCGHCVAAVTEEVGAVAGVREVVVDLASGSLTFASDEPVSRDVVEAAVREAGYTLA